MGGFFNTINPGGSGGSGGTPDPTPTIAPMAAQPEKAPKSFPGPTATLSLAPTTTTDIAPAASAFDEVL